MKKSVRHVRAGNRTIPAASATLVNGSTMFCDEAWREIGRSLGLSGRELEIIRSSFDDQKESVIAANLGIAPRTVHTHIERLHRKLGLTNRAQLLVRIMHEFLALTVCPEKHLPPICARRAAGRCPLQV